MGALPSEILVGGNRFSVEYVECIEEHPEAGSWLDANSGHISIRNTSALGIQKRHIILRLVGAITRLLSQDARLVRHEFPFGHTLFGILAMNRELISPDSIGNLEQLSIPGHEVKIVTGVLDAGNEGELDLNHLEIRVAEGRQGYTRFETVWHEAIHIICALIDVKLKEWQICFLSFCLASIFAQNDFSWLYDS